MYNKILDILIASFFLSKVYFSRKYKRFHLGIFWAFFPTLIVLIGAIISSKQLDFKELGFEYNYVLWTIPAFVIFRAITETFDIAQKIIQLSFILQRSLNIKSYHIFMGSIFASLFYLLIDIILISIVVFYFFGEINFEFLLYIYVFIFSVFLSVFISVIIGPFAMLIYDLRFISKFLRVLILACTPIFYLPPKEGIVFYINKFNPFTIIIESSRDVILEGVSNDLILVIITSIICLIISTLYFKIFSKQIQIINSTAVKGVVGQTYAWVNIFKTKLKNKENVKNN